MAPSRIRVIAIALIRRNDDLLVFEGFDSEKQNHYYRPLGGGVEPGEYAADALVREMREELGTDILKVTQLDVLENVFVCDGKPGHEVVFVFSCELGDRLIYDREVIDTHEHDGAPMRVVWRHIDSFDAAHRLVPEGIERFIRR